jgi:two-component system, OmpR family, sensor histidine kinase VicK
LLLISKNTQDKFAIAAGLLSVALIASFIVLAIFTHSDVVYYEGMTYAVGAAALVLFYTLIFKSIRDKNEGIAVGLLFLVCSLIPMFLVDFLGGVDTIYMIILFPLIVMGFLLGPWWGMLFDTMTTAYIIISILFLGTDIAAPAPVFLALIVTSFIFYFIGERYRGALQEKADLESSNLQFSANQNKEEALLAGIADGVYVVDMDRNMTMFNGAAEGITGWKATEAIGLKCYTVMNLKNDTDISICQKDCPALNVWNTGENVLRDDCCFNRKKGNKRVQISSSYSPIKDKNGKLTGAICVFRDITSRKEVERLRNEFVSTASHELRTPITAMEGYMELIENEKICKIDDKAREYVTKARGQALGMSNLVKNLLTVTKIEEGKIQTNVTKFNIHELAAEVVEAMGQSAKGRGLEIKMVESTGQAVRGEKAVGRSLNVVADKEQVREVMYNLVENGLKFTVTGGVSISIAYDKDFATVCVTDTGMGIPADGQKHIFEKFYRYDNTATREVGGTGLGLFITRSIVEMFGGTIWLESQVDKGTKFFFTIPRSLD